MDIATGIAAAKTAADLFKDLQRGLQSGAITPNEILGRLLEIQGLVLDARTALQDVGEENAALKKKVKELQQDNELLKQLQPDEGVYWYLGLPHCPNCYQVDRKAMRLDGPFFCGGNSGPFRWACPIHKSEYRLQRVPPGIQLPRLSGF